MAKLTSINLATIFLVCQIILFEVHKSKMLRNLIFLDSLQY